MEDVIVWDGDTTLANTFFGEDYGTDWEFFEGSQDIRLHDGQRCNVGDTVTKLSDGRFKIN